MDIADFLSPERVVIDAKPRDKAQLISEVAKTFARTLPGLHTGTIETALLAREQLGSTGLGNGFALPHARLEGLAAYAGLFARLAKPIGFDAIDARPVSMVFVLLIPFDTDIPHVAALAAISRRFRDSEFLTRLKAARTATDAFAVLASQ